jgi:hypothetical protein
LGCNYLLIDVNSLPKLKNSALYYEVKRGIALEKRSYLGKVSEERLAK